MSIIPLYSFLKTKLDKVSAGPLKWTVCFGYEEAEITQKFFVILNAICLWKWYPNHVIPPLYQCLFFHLPVINSTDLNKHFILIKYVIQDIFCFFKFTSYVSIRTNSVVECLIFRMQKWYNFQHYLLLMSAKKNILCAKNKKKLMNWKWILSTTK